MPQKTKQDQSPKASEKEMNNGMKKNAFQSPESDETEKRMMKEVTAPIRLGAVTIILGLFILLPVFYVLVFQTPGSWLPKDMKETPVVTTAPAPEIKNDVSVNPYAQLDSLIIKASNQPSFENYFQLSFAFYNTKKFKEAITAAEKALEYNPKSGAAYNNICSSYNELKKYDKAIEACKKALEFEPGLQIAKNNLKWAEKQQN